MEDLNKLFSKYISDDCTTAEIALLMQYFGGAKPEAELKSLIQAELEKDIKMVDEMEDQALDSRILHIYDRLKVSLDGGEQQEVPRISKIYRRYAAAAAILIAVSAGIYFYKGQNKVADKTQAVANIDKDDATPGGNKAVLVLADGSELSLTDADNGELARQAGIKVSKTADGQLVYEVSEGAVNTQPVYNTIKTPVGGQYQLNLPDGTKVWLNALSSLTFPANFNGNERRVVLKGEAYFEVAKNDKKPFVVSSTSKRSAQDVKVLGTHFNINSYDNEATIKTTLLEGRVQVSSKVGVKLLQPGQLSVLDHDRVNVYTANVSQTIDWKNGDFIFSDEGIPSIMRKLERWYDIEVVYQGVIPAIGFTGEISRSKKLSEVLSVLKITKGVNFKIEGRRVTVMQ